MKHEKQPGGSIKDPARKSPEIFPEVDAGSKAPDAFQKSMQTQEPGILSGILCSRKDPEIFSEADAATSPGDLTEHPKSPGARRTS